MAFPWLLAAEIGLLAGDYAIRQLLRHDKAPPRGREVEIPRTDEGAPIPIIFGKCRIRQPILIGAMTPRADYAIIGTSHDEGEPLDWGCNMTFVLGAAGFPDGLQRLHVIYAGEVRLLTSPPGGRELEDMTGDGSFETPAKVFYQIEDPDGNYSGGGYIGGNVEFLNGNSSQVVVSDTFPYTPATVTGENLAAIEGTGARVPGLRGYLSAQLFESLGSNAWTFGREPQAGSYSFIASSFPSQPLYRQKVDGDANPADVLWWLLRGELAACGLPASALDYTSFLFAAETLDAESHGYSRAIESNTEASEIILEILRQIDALLFMHPLTGLITLKLIRYDYNARDVPTINVDNCERLDDFAYARGTANKIRVVFTDRDHNYLEGSAQAHSFVGAVGQPAQAAEEVLQFPGVTKLTLANKIAARELDARSRTLASCRVRVARDVFRNVVPGDVLRLEWWPYSISMLMRVGAVDAEGRDDNSITLRLVQESFITRRFEHDSTGLPTHGGAIE